MTTTYHLTSHEEDEWWRTISVVTIDGEPHAYQQKCEVGRPKYKNTGGVGTNSSTFGSVVVETDEHRFIPVRETVSEENTKELVEGFK